VPPEIAMCEQLVELKLHTNKFTEFPVDLTALVSLKSLDLHKNKIKTVPASISQMTALVSLNLKSNRLSTLPPEISFLKNLRNLNLEANVRVSCGGGCAGFEKKRLADRSLFPAVVANRFSQHDGRISSVKLARVKENIDDAAVCC
jgi:hypothetical protein